jgi:hypothetical protein
MFVRVMADRADSMKCGYRNAIEDRKPVRRQEWLNWLSQNEEMKWCSENNGMREELKRDGLTICRMGQSIFFLIFYAEIITYFSSLSFKIDYFSVSFRLIVISDGVSGEKF